MFKKLLFALVFGYLCFQAVLYILTEYSDFFLVEPYAPGVVKSIESKLLPTATVSRVVDGDTIVLDSGETVRLIGIDSPEMYPEAQCYGEEAEIGLRDWLVGQEVSLEKDVSETDKYERLLRYVWIDDVLVNEKIVARGWARSRVYEPDTMHENELFAAQTVAQEGSLGMWSEESGCAY